MCGLGRCSCSLRAGRLRCRRGAGQCRHPGHTFLRFAAGTRSTRSRCFNAHLLRRSHGRPIGSYCRRNQQRWSNPLSRRHRSLTRNSRATLSNPTVRNSRRFDRATQRRRVSLCVRSRRLRGRQARRTSSQPLRVGGRSYVLYFRSHRSDACVEPRVQLMVRSCRRLKAGRAVSSLGGFDHCSGFILSQ